MGFAAASIWFGTRHQDYVFTVIGLGVAALVGLCLLLVLVLAVQTFRRVRADQSVVQGKSLAGTKLLSPFHLPRMWLPLVRRSWSWLAPAGVIVEDEFIDGEQWERLRFLERGLHTELVRHLVCEDIFGFCHIAFRRTAIAELEIEPEVAAPFDFDTNLQTHRDETWAHPVGSPTGDWIEMRRYVPGDPLKRVLWKAFARNRTLMVRTPEAAVGPVREWFIYLVAGPGDESAASMVSTSLRVGTWGQSWQFGADGSAGTTDDVDEAIRRICLSSGARSKGGAGLESFLARAQDQQAPCVIFLPQQTGVWLERIERSLRAPHAGSVQLVFVLPPALVRTPALGRRLLQTSQLAPGAVFEHEWNRLLVRLAEGVSQQQILIANRDSGVWRPLEFGKIFKGSVA